MFKNYLKIALRNLGKHKLFTGLNVFGLATGMACSILIFLWVQDERSYDQFNPHYERTYRLTSTVMGTKAAPTPVPMKAALVAQLPAVEHATSIIIPSEKRLVTFGTTKFEEKTIAYADSNFLQMFNYPLLKGNAATVLSRPGQVVITERAAKKYFGVGDPLGKIIHIDNSIKGSDLTVVGILKALPHNSHLQFDFLVPMSVFDPNISWGTFNVFTYLRLDPHFNASSSALAGLEEQINTIYKKNDVAHTIATFQLQPLADVHLYSHLLLDVEGQGNMEYVNIFSLVAIFILVIACINFMNLSTALSGQRAKEVGMRKALGAKRLQLVMQFICESFLLSFVALCIGMCIAFALLPLFNDLAAKSLSIDLLNARIIFTLLGIAIGVGLLSGSYPALFLSGFNPVTVLKGNRDLHGNKSLLRNGLVIVQFSISVVLMICTVVVYRQLQFIRHQDIGFNKNNLLYVEMPRVGDLHDNYEALKARLVQQTDLHDYTVISDLPVTLTDETNQLEWPGKIPGKDILAVQMEADENFASTFGMHMLTGRFFEKDRKTDANGFVVNEEALKAMGMNANTAVGQKLELGKQEGVIIGVVKNFNFKPIQQPVEPLIMRYNNGGGFFVIRTATEDIAGTLERVKTLFHQVYPDYPFAYGFISDDLSHLYVTEQRMGKLFNVFALLSIVISCLGLFGLATFATQKRIKEIGIRKVLGAKETSIVTMLSKDFIQLVLLALVVAFPLARWVMGRWLNGFAYRVDISWWIYAIAGLAAVFIALLTISYQAVRAAWASPVKSLKAD